MSEEMLLTTTIALKSLYILLFPILNGDSKGLHIYESCILQVVYASVFQIFKFLVYFENMKCGHLKYKYRKDRI